MLVCVWDAVGQVKVKRSLGTGMQREEGGIRAWEELGWLPGSERSDAGHVSKAKRPQENAVEDGS